MTQEHGLPAYLTAKAAAMEDALKRKPDPHQWLDHLEVTARTDDASGVRKIDIREWRLLSTGGRAVGDYELGPASPENALAAIASCLTQVTMILAAQRTIPLEHVRVEMRSLFSEAALFGVDSSDPYGLFDCELTFDLGYPGATEEVKRAFVEDVMAVCGLLQLLRKPTTVAVCLENEPLATVGDLSNYLAHKRHSLQSLQNNRPSAADWRDPIVAECTVDNASGVRRVRAGDWHSIHNGGSDFGDYGLGVMPTELFLGSLGSCLTHIILLLAAQQSLPVQGVRTRVEADSHDARYLGFRSDEPLTGLAAHVSIAAPSLTVEAKQALLQDAEQHCGLLQTLARSNDFRVQVL